MPVVLLLYVIAEVVAVWAVASAVGILWTIVLLLGGAFLGTWLARREGGKVAGALFSATRAGKPGYREITDSMLVALGGLLILLPGFITDLAGILVMLPPGRGLIRKQWLRKMERAGYRASESSAHRIVVVDGEVVSDDKDDGADPWRDYGPGNPRIINP